MAYRLAKGVTAPQDRGTLLVGSLGCYDLDETLHERSRYEFVRNQLTDAQRAELDQVGAFWRAHPEAFNEDFLMLHAFENKKTAMAAYGITDDKGQGARNPPLALLVVADRDRMRTRGMSTGRRRTETGAALRVSRPARMSPSC